MLTITIMTTTLKRKCLHFDEIFVTGCTGSCQNDNFQCRQWLKFRQNDDIFVSVNSNIDDYDNNVTPSFEATLPIARFTWPTRGLPGSCRPQVGPMLAPWTLLSGNIALIVSPNDNHSRTRSRRRLLHRNPSYRQIPSTASGYYPSWLPWPWSHIPRVVPSPERAKARCSNTSVCTCASPFRRTWGRSEKMQRIYAL